MSANEAPRRRLRGPSEEDEQAAAGRLIDVLNQMAAVIARHEKLMQTPSQVRSELASDDAMTAPLPTSNLVIYSQNVAVDNVKALRALLLQGDGLTLYQVAQYPLLRAAIESSAEVIWLLGPDQQSDRVRRLLIARASEYKYDRALVATATVENANDGPATKKERARIRQGGARQHKNNLRSLRQIGAKAGLSEDEYIGTDLPWQDIIEYASRLALAPSPEIGPTLWRVASGFSHPSSSRSLMMSVIEQDGETVGDDIPARVSASVQNVASTAQAALTLLKRSELLIRYRRLKPAPRTP